MRLLIRRRWRALSLLFLLVAALAGIAIWVGLLGDLPPSEQLIHRSSPDTTKIYDRNGRLLYEILDPRAGRRTRVPLADLPLNLQHAVIATEDGNFYRHPGVDPVGIARALWMDIQARGIVAGGSTITQQLARDLLLSQQESETRSFIRKIREAVLAIRLTAAYSKDTILAMYLNESYFGELAYGAEAAARVYFGKPARDLDLAESAMLAGLIQSPPTYNPLVNIDAGKARQKIVLDLMVKRGYITPDQARLAQAEPLHFVGTSSEVAAPLRAPHFVAYVRNLLEAQYGPEAVNAGGLSVVTTLDVDLEQQAETIVKRNVSELLRRTREEGAPDNNLHDAALVALDPHTGEILAMVGSADYYDENIQGAVNVALANRQPGSAIKPITYATAFARDLSPASIFSDVPTTFQTRENEPYAPENYDRTWHGPISLRTALATSSNMVAVKVLDHVGIENMLRTAHALGISTFNDSDRFGLALTLGGGEVKLIELTAAYAAFANGGRRVEPRAILSVNGDQVPDTDAPEQAVSPQVAYLITNVLSDDRARIPAFGEDSLLNLSRPAAAKTGTTTDFRDNWTIGYTPDLAVGVWAGNADNEPMYKISGITGAAPIWHDFIESALRDKPSRDFQRPDGLVDVEVCETSGLLPGDECPRIRTEIFIAGTEPHDTDNTYQLLTLDSATGLLWTDGCKGQPVKRVVRYFPPDARDWADRQGFSAPPEVTCLGSPPGAAAQAKSPSEDATGVVKITSPAANSTFQVSSQLPPEMQQIEISALVSLGERPVQLILLVDGRPVGTFESAPYRLLWPISTGAHTVQAAAVLSSGQRVESEPVQFTVTGP